MAVAAASLVATPAAQGRAPARKPPEYSRVQVAAGKTAFAAHCGFCHGRDAMGGQTGPDLTRSSLVADDVKGDKIRPLVRAGRPDKGMPALALAESQLSAIVAFIHDTRNKSGAVLGSRGKVADEDLRGGDPAAGAAYFNGTGGCTKCHSATGDLAGVADRVEGLALLQRMLNPRSTGKTAAANATVTLPSGEKVSGRVAFRDEFTIALRDADGWHRSWRARDVKVELDDPIDAHLQQVRRYSDADMHNVLAYLQTLSRGAPRRKPAAKKDTKTADEETPALPPPTGPPALDPATLLAPRPDSWPTYHGDYSGRRHSALSQITPDNVRQLTLAWTFDAGESGSIKSSPILVNGILYFTAPDHMWAVDARSGRQVWHYVYPTNTGFHIGHRGAAMHRNTVFLTTPDAYLVALDARNGKLKWKVEIASAKKGYWSSNAPLVVRDHVIVGVSGDFDNLPGMLTSFDPETGAKQWVFYSTPPQPPASGPHLAGATGGQMWMTGTYDPQLNLVFVGTGNPTPVLNGDARPGDNPWTCSIVAIDPDTGKLAWGFQPVPHDTHDWDAAEVPVLVDAVFDGAPRKLLLQASRNGYYFVLDRTTGKSLLTTPFATTNWTTGIAPDGRPIPDPAKEPSRNGRLVAPSESGGTNYRSPSFDPGTGLFIVSALDGYGIYFFKPEHGAYGWAGADYNVNGAGAIRAIDYRTGAVRWNHDIGGGGAAGVLTTATGVTFTGDTRGNALALRTSDGATLWNAAVGGVGNSPITYELDGRQYLLIGGGGALFAFALPADR